MPQAYITRYCGYHTAGISPVRRTDIIEKSISVEMHFSWLRAVRHFGRHPCLPAVLPPQGVHTASPRQVVMVRAVRHFGRHPCLPAVLSPLDVQPHIRCGLFCFDLSLICASATSPIQYKKRARIECGFVLHIKWWR